MRLIVFGTLLFWGLLNNAPCLAQYVPGREIVPLSAQRDTNAVAILTQSLAAAGGAQALQALRDLEGNGTITYFSDGQETSGAVTVKARGASQFRLDAELPRGTRSVLLNGKRGRITTADGNSLHIPSITLNSIGNLTYPYALIAVLLTEPGSRMAYMRTVDIDGQSAYEIRVMRRAEDLPDPRIRLSHDYFIDAKSYLVVRVADSTYPANPPSNFPHAIDYAEYKKVSGLLIPFRVSEMYMGTTTWTMHVDNIQLNIGLTDSHFAVD